MPRPRTSSTRVPRASTCTWPSRSTCRDCSPSSPTRSAVTEAAASAGLADRAAVGHPKNPPVTGTPAQTRARLRKILAMLDRTFPGARLELDFTTPLELLVALVL